MTPSPCSPRQLDMRFRQHLFIVLFTSALFKSANTSIAGVTYMDDFDFEERYAKCKPQEGPLIFWYLGDVPIMSQPQMMPAIMPEMMPQSEIMMSEIMAQMPQQHNMLPQMIPQQHMMPEIIPQMLPQQHMIPETMPQMMPQMIPQMMPHIMSQMIPHIPHVMPQIAPQMHLEYVEHATEVPQIQPIQPSFEALYESFKRDISKKPVAPILKTTKELGNVHVYHQPVSYETMTLIKKLSKSYFPAMT